MFYFEKFLKIMLLEINRIEQKTNEKY
jgi:hypothetical protein